MADEQLQLVVDAGRGGLALRRRRAHVGDDFRAADQHARIDAGEVADDRQDEDRPQPKAARAAQPAEAAAAAPILDVVESGVFSHSMLRAPGRFRPPSPNR